MRLAGLLRGGQSQQANPMAGLLTAARRGAVPQRMPQGMMPTLGGEQVGMLPDAEAGAGGLGALLGAEDWSAPPEGAPPAPTVRAADGSMVANPESTGAASHRWKELFPQLGGDAPTPGVSPQQAGALAEGLQSQESMADLQGKLQYAQQLASTPDQYATPTNPWAPAFAGINRFIGQRASRKLAGELAEVSGERRSKLAAALGQAQTDGDVTRIQSSFGANPEEVQWRRDKIAADEAQRMSNVRFDLTQRAQFVSQQLTANTTTARDQNRAEIAKDAAAADREGALKAAAYLATIQQLSRHRLLLKAEAGNEAAADILATELGWSPTSGRRSGAAGQLRDSELEKQEMGNIALDPELAHSGWAAANLERIQSKVTAGGETHAMPWGFRTVNKEGLTGDDLTAATSAEAAFKSKFTMALLMSPDRSKFDALVKFHQMNGDKILADPAMVQRSISEIQRARSEVIRAANKTGRTLQQLLADPSAGVPEDAFDWPDTAVRDRMKTTLGQELMEGKKEVPPEWNVREDMREQFENPTPDFMLWTFQEMEKAKKDPEYRPAFWPDVPADTGMDEFTRTLGDDLRTNRTSAFQVTDQVIAEYGENWQESATERIQNLQGRFATLDDDEKAELRRLLTALTVGQNAGS